ncbi:MAG: TIGR04076 family protein [Armatimonadota bacterium]
MLADVRITVLRRLFHEDLVAEHCTHPWVACQRFTEGDEFIVPGDSIEKPEGFCSWAWVDMNRYVVTLARGGNFSGSKRGRTVVSCSDGYRPVLFLLERIEPDAGDT